MKHVLFIQGGGEGAYEEDGKLAASLRAELGDGYHVIYSQVANEDDPTYAAWKEQITADIASVRGKIIAVGHSLGGSFLLKYLTEETVADRIAGIFLIATPYIGAPDWEFAENTLPDDFAARLPQVPIYLYHSRGDESIPFEHLAMYAAKLPNATKREFDGRGHQFNDDLSEVAADIKRL